MSNVISRLEVWNVFRSVLDDVVAPLYQGDTVDNLHDKLEVLWDFYFRLSDEFGE